MTKQAKPVSKRAGQRPEPEPETKAADAEPLSAPPQQEAGAEATPEAPGPQSPETPSPEARRAAPGVRWVLVAAIVAVAFILGAALWPVLLPRLGLTLPAGLVPVPELEDRVVALEARATESDRLGQAVGGEVAGVAASVTALEARLARLEAEAGRPTPGVEDLRAALGRVAERLAALEVAPMPAPAPDARLAARLRALEGALASAAEGAEAARDLGREAAALDARLSRLDERLDGLQASLTGAGADGALVVAAGQLKGALSGPGPFAASLAAVTALAGDDPELEGPLAELARYAAAGAPTIAGLQAGFAALADEIVRAEAAGRRDDWLGVVLDWAGRLVSLRRTGELEGETTEGRVARAERRLEAGNLAAAVAELEALEGAAAGAASAWLARARARLAVEQALAALERRVIARLGGAGGEPR